MIEEKSSIFALLKTDRMNNLLVAENITKTYGNQVALTDISLFIPRGSIFGLLGPNGAGKTTFIRILNQIIYPDSGRILFDNEPLNSNHIGRIGYLPEERGLYKSMKVGEQVLYLAQLKGLSKLQAKQKLDFWFERLEISHWKNKKIQELSKGMAQKVQFVVTILHEPKLLIFDEIFSGLDPINAEVIKEQVLYLREQGATIIFSTHRMESVEEMCDHIALIDQSRKILDGKLIDIKCQFKTHTYEVGILCENPQKLHQELSEKFQISEAYFKSIRNETKLLIHQIEDETPNDLLHYLISKGEVTHFSEVIPTANDIFIQAVKQSKSPTNL